MNVPNAVPLLDEAGKACRCSSSKRQIAWQERNSTSADHCTKHGDAANSNVASRCSQHFFCIESVRGYIHDTFRPCAQLVRCSMQESYASISMRYARRLGASPSMRIDLTQCRVPTTAMHGLTLDSHACVRQRAVVALAFVFPFAASMISVYMFPSFHCWLPVHRPCIFLCRPHLGAGVLAPLICCIKQSKRP